MTSEVRPTTEERLAKLAYIEAVLGVGWKVDSPDFAFWRPDASDGWRAYAICSDFFAWATADAEEVAPEDVPLLERCAEDLLEVERAYKDVRIETLSKREMNDAVATAYVGPLFASRKRRLRPMRAVYEDQNAIGPRLAALFDAAGPERTDSQGKRTKVYDQEARET